jgi:ABC-type transport system involved in multi-copper enzyme maturation permease subunit
MLKTLIQKEIRAGIFSFRFAAVAALLIVVIPVSVFILANDAVRKADEYAARQAGIETYLKDYAHFNRLSGVIQPSQPPLPIQAFVRGTSSDANIGEFDNDPLPVLFPLIDLTFIISILLSLAALVLSYDAVSGEREEGTLKLQLANNLSRSSLILGKIIGGMAILVIPFFISIVLSLLVILLNPRLSWGAADGAALALVCAGAVVYILVFLALGVFISARHRSSGASVMTALCAWVFFVLLIPNLSPYAASIIAPTPSRITTSREIARLTDIDRDELGRRLQAQKYDELIRIYPVLAERLSEEEAQARILRDPAYREAKSALTRAVQEAWDEANRIQGEKAETLEAEQTRREEAQTRLAKIISMASPLPDFTYLATDLTSTGMRNERFFNRLAVQWGNAYREYRNGRIAALQKEDPAVDWWNTPVDVSNMPRFRYAEEDLTGRISGVLPEFAILLAMGLGFFAAAFVSFIRYDAR